MSARLRVFIASDHAGFALKQFIIENVKDVDWDDKGPANADRVDYPDFAAKVAREVSKGKGARGVLICGSGIGMSISANKIAGVRAAVVESEVAARLSRNHNDANVLCLGARIVAAEYAKEIVQVWLQAQFEGGRHTDRVRKISALESREGEDHDPAKSC